MRLMIQRVKHAQVIIEDKIYSAIKKGLLVFLGIHPEDQMGHIKWSVNKLIHLRIFNDENGKMNLSLKEIGGQILVVSQFTLYGNCLHGRRPDYLEAAAPHLAIPVYEQFIQELRKEIPDVQTGKFGAHMEICLSNDGPVTFFIEAENKVK